MSKGELFNHNNESKLDSKNKYEETPATSLNENENKINIDENSEKDKKKNQKLIAAVLIGAGAISTAMGGLFIFNENEKDKANALLNQPQATESTQKSNSDLSDEDIANIYASHEITNEKKEATNSYDLSNDYDYVLSSKPDFIKKGLPPIEDMTNQEIDLVTSYRFEEAITSSNMLGYTGEDRHKSLEDFKKSLEPLKKPTLNEETGQAMLNYTFDSVVLSYIVDKNSIEESEIVLRSAFLYKENTDGTFLTSSIATNTLDQVKATGDKMVIIKDSDKPKFKSFIETEEMVDNKNNTYTGYLIEFEQNNDTWYRIELIPKTSRTDYHGEKFLLPIAGPSATTPEEAKSSINTLLK